ncbi:TIGR03089 family protein [Actinoplanes sp. NPDC026619]|uniref:TIGR03089 family protein n=1 Tax=Actinoplanes sp. NPDC026619 TaxID=3155798 RepID=UPI0033CADCF9
MGELFTYYDDATGERIGLTAAQLSGWSAATAALLTEGCGLGPGDQAAVLLPPHWQTAAVLLGAWSAGIEVSYRGWATAGLAPAGDPLDVTFVQQRRIGSWLDEVPAGRHQFVLGLAPAGAPATDVPEDYRDFATEVRPYLGAAPPASPIGPASFGEYAVVAAGLAEMHRIGPGDRVLIQADASEQPLMWLLAPLSAGASIVLCANLDESRLDDRVTAEGVTRVLGSPVP